MHTSATKPKPRKIQAEEENKITVIQSDDLVAAVSRSKLDNETEHTPILAAGFQFKKITDTSSVAEE